MKKKIWIIVLASVAAIALIVTAVIALSSGETKNSWQEQYDLGVRYLNEGNYEEAIIAFTAAIEIDPRNSDLYVSRANVYTEMGDLASARADYEAALEIDDSNVDAWLGLAETYAAEGNIEKALEILQDAATKTSDPRIKAKIEELESKLAPSHVHTWLDATCTEPKTCSECGETEGDALGHNMLPATVDAPSICSRCGYTEGNPANLIASGKCGENVTWAIDGHGILTIDGSGPMQNYFYYNYAPWYNYRSEIYAVFIDNGVTRIGDFAFCGCQKLINITIPNSVITIGDDAFSGCENITSVTFPRSVASVGESAFFGCKSLRDIFVDEYNSEYVSINGVLFTADMTLLHTYPAAKVETEYIIPDSVTSIGRSAFHQCANLTSITIPNGVTKAGFGAFMGCSSLVRVNIPTNMTKLDSCTFYGCSSLTDLTIPNSILSIDEWAFAWCENLISIIIPNSVKTMGFDVFIHCHNLTRVIIPSSVTTIGEGVFSFCDSLTDIYYGGTEKRWAAIAADADVPETATVHYNYSE